MMLNDIMLSDIMSFIGRGVGKQASQILHYADRWISLLRQSYISSPMSCNRSIYIFIPAVVDSSHAGPGLPVPLLDHPVKFVLFSRRVVAPEDQ